VTRSSATSSSLWRRRSTVFWMTASFLVAAALAAIAFGAVGAHDRVGVALRVTARWSLLLFWLAYAGSAMATLWGPRFTALARHGREFGLAFASAQLVHVVLILLAGVGGGMAFFWSVSCSPICLRSFPYRGFVMRWGHAYGGFLS
jgi:hypothetical protein